MIGRAEKVIAARYAKGLFAAVGEKGAFEAVSEELAAFSAFIADEDRGSAGCMLRTVFEAPRIKPGDKLAVLEDVLTAFGAGGILKNFLKLVVAKGRIRLIGEIACQFGFLADEALGRDYAVITTAEKLPREELGGVVASVEGYVKKKIRYDVRVDPSILAGVVVRVKNMVIDNSLRTDLERLRKHMR